MNGRNARSPSGLLYFASLTRKNHVGPLPAISDAACADRFQEPPWLPSPSRCRPAAALLGLGPRTDADNLDADLNIELARKRGLGMWLDYSSTSQSASQFQRRQMLSSWPAGRTGGNAPGSPVRGLVGALQWKRLPPIILDELGLHQGPGKRE